jgi:pimeloyl-ACP methyl ester carboxylesterase
MVAAAGDVDVMIERVIDRASIPGRAGEPRLAHELAGVETAYIDTVHGKIAAWRVGPDPAVLLVHGWRDSARLWDPLMARLRAVGRSFVALDLPGHGFSEGARCLTAEVPDAVAAVAAALGPVNAAVAHSFACVGTALAVAEGLSLDKLVMVSPALAYRAPNEAAGDAVDAAHQRWRRIAAELGYDAAVGDVALDTYLARMGPRRGTWDLAGGLARLPTEMLVMASVDDERFDVDAARSVVADTPHCHFIALNGLDHRASARDTTAIDAILHFLDSAPT